MKLTAVELHPSDPANAVVMSFKDPGRLNPYNVKAITGLDADEIVARYYGGNSFYSLMLNKRDIVAQIALHPRFEENESYSSLRDHLYRVIQSSRTGKVQLQFKNLATVVAAVSGFITKFEATHFERDPMVQITVKCDEPILRSLTATSVNVTGLDPADTTITDALSTAPHGFEFVMTITDVLASFKMGDINDDSWSFEVIPDGGFLADDELHFSSDHQNKQIYVVRGLDTIYLADKITPGSIWPIIFPGDNEFYVENPTDVEWTSISYYPSYWGV